MDGTISIWTMGERFKGSLPLNITTVTTTVLFIGDSLESPKLLLLAFRPKILRGSGDLQSVLCHSVNAGLVVGLS